MLTLNLLSQEKKEELKFFNIYRMGKDFICVMFIFTVLVAIILAIANVILINTFNDTVFSSYLLNNSDRSFESDLNVLNKKLQNIKEIQNSFVKYDDLMVEITNLIPENIALDFFSVNTQTKKATFKGYAKERSSFLNLKKNLENSPIFKNAQSPITNLLEKNNVNFNITADIN